MAAMGISVTRIATVMIPARQEIRNIRISKIYGALRLVQKEQNEGDCEIL
jgi:hypothetical protein